MIEFTVRAIIQNSEGKILTAKMKGKDYYFLPGGHVEYGETAEQALRRELHEELALEIKGMSFAGAMENLYEEDGQRHHEFFVVFEVEAENVQDKSQEDHIDFFFLSSEELKQEKFLPVPLKEKLVAWLQNKQPFWESEMNL